MIHPTPNMRCSECRHEASAMEFLINQKRCPHCGSTFQFDPDSDLIIVGHARTETEQGGIWVRLNWQEFRILAIWSRFWADQQNQEDPDQWGWMLRVVDAITHQIKKAAPFWPLTIADEAGIAREQNPGKEVLATRPDGSEVQLEPTWLNKEITRFEPPAPKEKT